MYPSVITSFTYPTPTDRLNSPSHSALHNTTSSAVGQVEAFVGTLSSAQGTLVYDIRSPDSDGGGHVQTAVKGGTGQITFTKGDVLVASSPSVLTKLAVGLDSQVLSANSSVATGVQWVNAAASNKIAVSSSSITIVDGTVAEVSVMSVTIPGSTLGTSNAVRATLYVQDLSTLNPVDGYQFRVNYGTASTAFYSLGSVGARASVRGQVYVDVLANQSASAQKVIVYSHVGINTPGTGGFSASVGGAFLTNNTPMTQNSTAPLVLGVTVTPTGGNGGDRLVTTGYIVERIT